MNEAERHELIEIRKLIRVAQISAREKIKGNLDIVANRLDEFLSEAALWREHDLRKQHEQELSES